MRRITYLALAGWLLTSAHGMAAAQTYLEGYQGPYRGRVLDAETKEPLAGAVVVAVWSRVKMYPLHSSTVFYAAREVVTEVDGTFVLNAREIEEGAPERTRPPYFEIFAPGYGSRRSFVFTQRGFQHGRFDDGPGATVGLPRLKTKEERLQNLVSPYSLFVSTEDLSDAPFRYTPHLVRLVNSERVSLGLRPYTEREKQP